MTQPDLCCPSCQQLLTLEAKTLRCPNNHCYDQAKQGYFNLLLSNMKRSKQPGDNAEMVIARKKFLDTGIYQPISDALNTLSERIQTSFNETHSQEFNVLDIGCGEGYYTDRLHQALSKSERTTKLIGLDISKEATKYAAKRNKNITWIVASGADVPVLPNSQNLITCLFTRLMPEGMANALSKDGTAIVISTGRNHLMEMREVLYSEVKDQVMDPETSLTSHFQKTSKERVTFTHTLDSSEQIMDLLAMTPHQWRAPEGGRLKLQTIHSLTITVDVNITLFKHAQARL